MEIEFSEAPRSFPPETLEEIARTWNANAVGHHAFFPWTGELLARQLTDRNGAAVGRFVLARTGHGDLIGFAHVNQIREDGYPSAGDVEVLLVDSGYRKRGIGTGLLERAVALAKGFRPAPGFIDALGAWPFGYGFTGMVDGSERSGVFLREEAAYRLFRRNGFEPVRPSLVMRVDLSRVTPRPLPPGTGFYIAKRTENTWLDRVFRQRTLWDHELVRTDRRILSWAIFGFMEELSRQEGRAIFSVFGVNTPKDMQGKGYAGINISHMLDHIRGLGADQAELHVYADNTPALALYRGLGFTVVAETMMMHRRLE
ncbi:MAG: GNAT family N-acetyltransferase [Planctomycetes bacterium]|nr:GNAT family N-acetyltransferase [Planctomycetota bacterium]